MIEFNLLPDIKLQFIKTRRLKRLIVSVSIIVSAAALALFIILLLYVDVFQKAHIHNLASKIDDSKSQLTSNKNLNEILTIQNQLSALPALYKSLPESQKLVGYLQQILPASCTISSITSDFTKNTISMSGSCNNAQSVNQLIDTIGFAKVQVGSSVTNDPAFTSVNDGQITPGSGNNNSTSYSIAFDFDPRLFNSQDNDTINVPNENTTRSLIDQPSTADLFSSGGK